MSPQFCFTNCTPSGMATLYTEISILMGSQTIWTQTIWRLDLRLVWLKQLWIFNCLWATPYSIYECLAKPEDTVLEDKGSCFLHIHPRICSEHQKEQGLLMTFSSDSVSLANPKGITKLPKAKLATCSLWFDIFFFRKEARLPQSSQTDNHKTRYNSFLWD